MGSLGRRITFLPPLTLADLLNVYEKKAKKSSSTVSTPVEPFVQPPTEEPPQVEEQMSGKLCSNYKDQISSRRHSF